MPHLRAIAAWLWQAFAWGPTLGRQRHWLGVIAWWELQRPIYNLLVGISGALSLVAIVLIAPATSLSQSRSWRSASYATSATPAAGWSS